MVKAVIYFSLIALFATSSVLAAPAPDAYYHRREAPEDELLARDADTANLQEREPFIGALIGVAARIGGRIAARAGSRVAKRVVKDRVNRHRKRDLEAEDELDLAARDELAERELDMVEREINENDILGRSLVEEEEDLYLD